MSQRPPILDAASDLADPTRVRILQLVEGHELTVNELCEVLQLPQSTVSRHLKVLATGGWVRSRREGTSNFYRFGENGDGGIPAGPGRLWRLIREQVAADPASAHDRHRLETVLAERRSRSQAFFATRAGHWDRLRDELFGPRFDLLALLDLLPRDQAVGDLACGTGRMAEALAPVVREVVAIDDSAAMVDAARGRLGRFPNVEVREGQLERLPVADGALDLAVMILALGYLPEPAAALAEARRVLEPGGRVLVVDMMPHEREEMRREMGHAWLGFSEEKLRALLATAGLDLERYRPLPATPEAKGPPLFVCVASVSDRSRHQPTKEPRA